MFHVVHTFALVGVEPIRIRVEITIRRGTPGIRTSGLAPSAARETVERIRAAAANLGLRIPGLRITVNLAPADVPKTGASFDLPLLIGVLAGAGTIPQRQFERTALVGELGLDGSIRPVRGILPMALRCRTEPDLDTLIVPRDNVGEVAGVPDVTALGAADLQSVLAFLGGTGELTRSGCAPNRAEDREGPVLEEVRGQVAAKRALEIAAAGGHHLLLSGEPGSGKTMLSMRLPGLLPPLRPDEALEVSSLHSVAGCLGPGSPLLRKRPFRAPHHSVSSAGLLGGGAVPRPGEASLAHRGVLFLDELPEFRPAVLDALRSPLDQGVVHIVRARAAMTFPARFQLVAAMNPCPCGYLTSSSGRCTCEAWMIRRYESRISGPLLDRFDIRLEIPAVQWADLRGDPAPGDTTAERRARVVQARNRALHRTAELTGSDSDLPTCNADLGPREIRRQCSLDPEGEALLGRSVRRFGLSARGCDRILRVARTVADLEGSTHVRVGHLAEALHYRVAACGHRVYGP